MTDETTLRKQIFSRQPEAITERLRKACIGIAGLGGLGSVVAENLARCGIGRLLLVDFDVIEPSNLNRQRYRTDQIGCAKVDALAENLQACCPFTRLTGQRIRLNAENCAQVFRPCDIVAECFDAPESKAALIIGLKQARPDLPVVAASGLAGLAPAESIRIEKRMHNVYTVGDGQSDAREGLGLFASRVGIVASMQSHLILRILMQEQ